MKLYRVQGRAVSFGPGTVLALLFAQALARLHNLGGQLGNHGKAKERRVEYTTTAEVQFKVGEEFGYAGPVPKAWDDVLVDLDAVKRAEREAAELEQRRAEEAAAAAAAAEQARTQHQAITVALANVAADANGNATIEDISKAVAAAKLDFQPTDDQLNAAWSEVIAGRNTADGK